MNDKDKYKKRYRSWNRNREKMKRIINKRKIELFKKKLYMEEKKRNTIEKYVRDLEKLEKYLAGRPVNKENMIEFKEYLQICGKYEINSINTYLAAVNHFCDVMGWSDAKVKLIKMQKNLYESEETYLTMKEYKKLISTANKNKKKRLSLIMQTIGGTGIRIGELCFVTVESLKKGKVDIYNKGKKRIIFYPEKLKKILIQYGKEQGISSGYLFRTRTGKPINRSNVWREMKKLCEEANIHAKKVFPHNLRHLFAREFYQIKNDIVMLADILGHHNIETTRIYIKSTGTEHKKALNKMYMVFGMKNDW